MSQKTIGNVKEATSSSLHCLFFCSLWIGMEFVLPAHAELNVSGLTFTTLYETEDSQGMLDGLWKMAP